LKVKIVYKNRQLQVVNVAEYDLDVYCFELSDRLIKTLTVIESMLDVDTLKENEAYQKVRHTLLDIAGQVKRMPDNLLLEPGQKIVWEDEIEEGIIKDNENVPENLESEPKPKLTLSLIEKLFGKVGE
jgi:hypothetical protein